MWLGRTHLAGILWDLIHNHMFWLGHVWRPGNLFDFAVFFGSGQLSLEEMTTANNLCFSCHDMQSSIVWSVLCCFVVIIVGMTLLHHCLLLSVVVSLNYFKYLTDCFLSNVNSVDPLCQQQQKTTWTKYIILTLWYLILAQLTGMHPSVQRVRKCLPDTKKSRRLKVIRVLSSQWLYDLIQWSSVRLSLFI